MSEDNKKGFSGLGDLLSDVQLEKAVPQEEKGSDAHSKPTSSVSGGNTSQPERSWWGAVMLIVACVGAYILFNNSTLQSPTSPTTPPQQTSSSIASNPTVNASNTQEEIPPVGTGLVLNHGQILYCRSEKVRLDGIEGNINKSADNEIAMYNAKIEGYNSRCSSFRYPEGLLQAVQSQVDANRDTLYLEGSEKLTLWRDANIKRDPTAYASNIAAKDPYIGRYESENGTSEITKIQNDQTSQDLYKIIITVGTPRCTGNIEATGNQINNVFSFVNEKEPKCALTATLDQSSQMLTISEDTSQCSNWHGAECDFNGHYGRKSSSGSVSNLLDEAKTAVTRGDFQEAFKLRLPLANQGNAEAQYWVGIAYELGSGVTKDQEMSIKWLLRSAEQGNSEAQRAIGWNYWKGIGVKQDDTQAAIWARRSAEQGNALGELFLGDLYDLGVGVMRSHAESLKWIRKAAEQGQSTAEGIIGTWYSTGTSELPKDAAESAKWLQRAADHGDTDAQSILRGNAAAENTAADLVSDTQPILFSKNIRELQTNLDEASQNDELMQSSEFKFAKDAQISLKDAASILATAYNIASFDIAETKNRNTPRQPDFTLAYASREGSYLLTPKASFSFENELYLVYDRNKQDEDCHACGGRVSVIKYHLSNKRLVVDRIFENLIDAGSWGSSGEIYPIEFNDHNKGFVIESGYRDNGGVGGTTYRNVFRISDTGIFEIQGLALHKDDAPISAAAPVPDQYNINAVSPPPDSAVNLSQDNNNTVTNKTIKNNNDQYQSLNK